MQLTRLLLNLHLAIPVAMPLLALLGWRYPRFRRLGPILLLVSTLIGVITTVISWRTGQCPIIDLSRVLPFPFVLTLDRLSSLSFSWSLQFQQLQRRAADHAPFASVPALECPSRYQ